MNWCIWVCGHLLLELAKHEDICFLFFFTHIFQQTSVVRKPLFNELNPNVSLKLQNKVTSLSRNVSKHLFSAPRTAPPIIPSVKTAGGLKIKTHCLTSWLASDSDFALKVLFNRALLSCFYGGIMRGRIKHWTMPWSREDSSHDSAELSHQFLPLHHRLSLSLSWSEFSWQTHRRTVSVIDQRGTM